MPSREAELLEKLPHPVFILADVRIDLAIRPLEVCVRDDPRPAMSWADDVHHVQVVLLDDPVQVRVDEVQARCRAPVSQQAWLDVVAGERLAQQRVVEQIGLPDGEVVCGPPEGVDLSQVGHRTRTDLHRRGHSRDCVALHFDRSSSRCWQRPPIGQTRRLGSRAPQCRRMGAMCVPKGTSPNSCTAPSPTVTPRTVSGAEFASRRDGGELDFAPLGAAAPRQATGGPVRSQDRRS